jgi:hypothetical protein
MPNSPANVARLTLIAKRAERIGARAAGTPYHPAVVNRPEAPPVTCPGCGSVRFKIRSTRKDRRYALCGDCRLSFVIRRTKLAVV